MKNLKHFQQFGKNTRNKNFKRSKQRLIVVLPQIEICGIGGMGVGGGLQFTWEFVK